MLYVYALAITALAWALRYWYDGPAWREEKACRAQPSSLMRGHLIVCRWTPDSDRYLAMGRGAAACWPFHARWLVPWLCGDDTRRWHVVTAGSLILSGPALAWYGRASGLTDPHALAGAAAFTGLWGAFGLLTLCPVLVDAPAMLVALAGAAAYLEWGLWPGLLGAALLAGAVKETGPVWLALFAWHPAPLAGLVVPLWRRYAVTHPLPDHDIVAHPVLSAQQYRRGTLTDGRIMLAPWGLGLLALFNPSPQLWVAVALAYAQPLMASDVTRLVQQVAPVVLIHAIVVIPEGWMPVVLAAHLFNVYQKTPMEEQPVRLQGIQ